MRDLLKLILTFALMSVASLQVAKAEGLTNYEVTFKVKGLNQGDTCMIAYYMGAKQYIRDTVLAGPGGVVVYKGSKTLDEGIYLFVMPGMNYFEFLFVEPKFSLETDKADPVANMKIKGSPENQAFYEYMKFLSGEQKAVAEIQSAISALPPADSVKKKELQAQLTERDKAVKAYRNQQIATHKGKYFSSLVKASIEPDVPEAPQDIPADMQKAWQLAKFRVLYLNQVDWADARLLRSPIIQNKMKDYLEKYTVDHPDSLIVAADTLVSRSRANAEVFKFAVITITNMYAGTKKMCFDKVYTHMAGQYYVSGQATWVDSTQLAKIKDRYYRMIYNDCDRKAVNLRMTDRQNNWHELYGVKAKYTLLVFWAYDCGHCKKEIPALYDFYKEYKKHGLEVFAVSTKEEVGKWTEFIDEKGIHDWINVADPENKTNFRILYDIYSTPVIYLLDENKTIIGKRLDIETTKKILNHELGIEEPKE